MADQTDSKGNAPEALAPVAAAPAAKPTAKPVVVTEAAAAPKAEPKAKPAVTKPAKAALPAVTPAAAKPARRKPAPVRSRVATAKKPRKQKAPKPAPAFARTASVTELKEKIMATKTTNFAGDFTGIMNKSMTDAVAEMQTKAQQAYDKGTSMVSEMTDLAKGNVEAIVESAKIVAAGVQDLGKTYADEAKTVYETMTADFKEMASVKSPTELFQLQGKIMRRNFDALVATSSKGSESAMKLANDAFAPISARVNLAVEKLSKAA
jgi:phasin family protein